MSVRSTGGGGAASITEVTGPSSPGILLSLSCFAIPPLEHNFQTYACIGIKHTENALEARTVQLAAGYVREEEGLTWTGLYPLYTGDRIYMFLRGNINPVFHLINRRLTKDTQILPGVTIEQLLRTAR